MFKTLTTNVKFLIPTFMLSIIMLFFAGTIIYMNYVKMATLHTLNKEIKFSATIANLIHSVQKERGLSCGYLLNPTDKFKKDLEIQKEKTDATLKIIYKDIYRCSKLSVLLAKIQETRNKILNYNISYNEIIQYYSDINTLLLNMIIDISKQSHVPLISQDINAYIQILFYKEYMAIERAIGVAIFSQQELDRKTFIRYSNIVALEKHSKRIFLRYAFEDMRIYYVQQVTSKKALRKLQKIRHSILYDDAKKINIDARYWFDLITKNLNALQKVSVYIQKKTLFDIAHEVSKLNTTFTLMLLLVIAGIIIFAFMLIAFFKLKKEEQRLRNVMDKYIISSITDTNGNIIDVSEAFCKISGYSRKELIGKNHNILRHPDMPQKIFKHIWYRITRGKPWRGKVKNLRKDGSFYWVFAHIEPLFNRNGKIDSYISIRLDITESELLLERVKQEEKKNKQQEEIMQQQSRLAQMGEMLSMIAHQWRQPLSAITAAAGAIQLKATRNRLDNDTAIELSGKITNFSKHLSYTIDDFREFFKQNKITKETNFYKVYQSVYAIIETSLEKNGIIIEEKIGQYNSFKTYENELKQVLLNLIKNAEDALIDRKQDEKKITIIIDKNFIKVRDNAGGIDPQILDKIFDPYFSTKTKKDGTGLGLYMSKLIVEGHCKGSLKVENIEDGVEFTIALEETK